MNYEVEFSHIMPSTSDAAQADKPAVLFGALDWACRTPRVGGKARLRRSSDVRFLKGQAVLMLDVHQDLLMVDETAMGRLKTAA